MKNDMNVSMFQHSGKIVPKIQYYKADPDECEDFDLWIVTIRQGDDAVNLSFRDYNDVHTFATQLMTEAASARP